MVPLNDVDVDGIGTGVVTCDDLLVDRHYRGAIVMVGVKVFAVAEEAIRLIERVQRGELRVLSPSERAALGRTLAELLAMGVLRPTGGEEAGP